LTQLELEARIAEGEENLISAKSLVMIQCVGCREENANYCARVCCSQAIKNALKLKEIKPEMEIYILFRDMRTYGFKEDYYLEAAEKPQVAPAVEEGRPVLRVTVPDPILGQRLAVDGDLVVLSAAVIPAAGSVEIARKFKVAMNPDGFFKRRIVFRVGRASPLVRMAPSSSVKRQKATKPW
jgi:heterodisulfide reductase subunit A